MASTTTDSSDPKDPQGCVHQLLDLDASQLTSEDSTILLLFHAITETPETHEYRQALYQHLKSLDTPRPRESHVDYYIAMQEQGVMVLGNENIQKPIALRNLARSLSHRFELSGDLTDIDGSIARLAEAIALASEDETKSALFGDLGTSYYDKFKRTGNLEDLGQAIESYHLAISHTPDDDAARPRFGSSLGLCHLDRFEKLGKLSDLDVAISCLSRAVGHVPNDRLSRAQCMILLGSAYTSRYSRLGQVEDIDMAIAFRSQVVQGDLEGSANNAMRLGDLADSFFNRYVRRGQIGDSQSAIEHQLSAVALTSDGDPKKATLLGQLGGMYNFRCEQLGNSDDFDQAIGCFAQAASVASDGDPRKLRALSTLGSLYHHRFTRLNRLEDLDDAADCFVRTLGITSEDHPDKAVAYRSLGELYNARFALLGELSDLEKALEFQTRALPFVPNQHPMKPALLNSLGKTLGLRYKSLGKREDGDRAIEYYQQAAQSPVGNPPGRLLAARSWGRLASSLSASLSMQGYKTMVDLLPLVFRMESPNMNCYGPELNIEDITTEVVAAAVTSLSFDLALELFDTCRVRAWKETLLLRNTPLTDLNSHDPHLANQLEGIAHELNHLGVEGDERAAQIGRRLEARWTELLDHIRGIPGFERFLQLKLKAELVQAAHSGTVIIVNAHESRCDALVIRPSEDNIAHVPLSTLSFQKAMSARSHLGKLLGTAESREGRMDVNGALGEMLGMLWDDVVQPVLEYLGYTRMSSCDELPRITWCLTGPLSGLPLHAAGRYDEPHARIFNYAVSSYAPSPSTLLVKPSPPQERDGILMVGQVATNDQEGLPGVTEEFTRVKSQANALRVTELTGDNATPQNVLAEMEKHSFLHLACPVSQYPTSPTTSTLQLPNGELALGAIMSKPRHGFGMVYLSRSGATAHDENILGEAFPLATGMIMAGYCTMITMMWSPQDQDAAMVAEKVYAHLNDKTVLVGTPAANALHTAVTHLRAEVGEEEFMRWIPYVHIGL